MRKNECVDNFVFFAWGAEGGGGGMFDEINDHNRDNEVSSLEEITWKLNDCLCAVDKGGFCFLLKVFGFFCRSMMN